MENKIVLASSSPRRIDMLRAHNIEPIIIPPVGEEIFPHHLSPEEAIMDLARQKAISVRDLAADLCKDDNYIIIGADTIVFLDRVIGKPKDRDDAYNILNRLRGREHYVATGVALIKPGSKTNNSMEKSAIFHEITKVGFKNYSDEDIEKYLDSDEPYDKAGAYAIQGGFAPYIDYIKGDYDNVVGFPWTRIEKELGLL